MGRPEFHWLADRELNEAAQYYELENPGLGASFLKEVDGCLQSIEDHPEAGVILRGSVRRRLLRRFPYALLLLGRPRVTPPRRPNYALQLSVSHPTPPAGQPACRAARR